MNKFPPASLILLLLIGSLNFTWAQYSFTGEINWKSPQRGGNDKETLYFEGGNYELDRPFLPKFCEGIKLQEAIAADYDLSFSNVSYAPASPREAELIGNLELDAQPRLTYSIGQTREFNMLSVCFYPYVKRQGAIQKVTSFEVEVVPLQGQGGEAAALAQYKSAKVSNSVLDAEDWYKIAVSNTGLYKITPSFLTDNNIASGNVPVANLRVAGNGTGMLPEKNSVSRPEDLLDVPMQVFDQNNDGIFNANDYAVFYAKGPHQWTYNDGSGKFRHKVNTYRTSNYYFITVSNGPGARVNTAPPVTGGATVQVNSFDDFDFEEKEEYNLVGTGRNWYGNLFDFDLKYNSKTFSFPNLDQSVPVSLRVKAAARASSGNTFMSVSVGGSQVMNMNFSALGGGPYPDYAQQEDSSIEFSGNSDNFVVQLTYDNSANPAGVAWLDFIEVQARRNLVLNGQPVYFRDAESVAPGQIAEFTISNASSNLRVWEVTEHNAVREIPLDFNAGTASFKNTADELREYVAFSGSGFSEPGFAGAVSRQNLHGLPPAEMLIVTHPKFYSAAKRLADFHIEDDNISTHVVTTTEVYNEFSSGGQDVTAIRDFARHNYEKNNAAGSEFNYLLLFGDASYDYKDRISNNSNYVPVYEGGGSLNLHESFITDDYFAYLDPLEGSSANDFRGVIMDIGVGRIPSGTLQQAEAYVDKVVHYTSSGRSYGDWRNRILLMADDVDGGGDTPFVPSSEVLENVIGNHSEAFNVDKIYTDAYDQVSTTGGESYPEASDDMFRKVQQGNLVTNYIGHGGEIGLSSEKLLKLSHINGWTNLDAMPLFTTFTCEFTRLDDPKRVSAGEQLALNPNGGAIALFSTTRVVQATPAMNLNESTFKTMFERPGNKPKTLGSILMDAKNDRKDSGEKLKFSLIGDPAVRLAIPYYKIQTNTINGQEVAAGNLDTLKALTKVSITGQVNDMNDEKMDDFGGIANVSVYDKANQRETRVNDGVGAPKPFTLRNNLIYRGKVEVTDGEFGFTFMVPKDISYKFGHGKISLYAHSGEMDAAGYMDTVMVGGMNSNPPDDSEGPVVELYMNDESFVRGGITDESPELYAIITDSSGVNTMGSGVGHDLVAVLDNKSDQPHVLNEYYEADLNSYQEGKVRYPFYELEEGQHNLKLKVFDVHNNLSEANTEFIVADSEDLALKKVLNYPNPFTTYTEFQFEHNRVHQPLEVQVQIFTVSGKLVKTINQLVVSEGNRVTGITWNGLDDYGDKIGKGVYVYRVKVDAQLDNSSAEQYEKLVILR